MNVTPLDIQQKQFNTGFRGYDRKEVEQFLELIREEMETLVREVTELREFHQSYDERLRALTEKEDMLKSTMFTTQKLVDELRENARKEASLIIKDAEVRAQQSLDRAQAERIKLEAELQNLKRRKHHFLQDMKKVVQMHLEMVNYEEAGEEVKDEQVAE
jgi:cell division initiation protein